MTCSFKYDMTNFVNFHPTTLKSKIFTSMGISSYKVWANKMQRSYLSRHWTVVQNLNKPWPCGFENGMKNWVNFQSTESLKNCTLIGSFCQKHIMFQLKNFREIIMCRDTEGWCKNQRKTDLVSFNFCITLQCHDTLWQATFVKSV